MIDRFTAKAREAIRLAVEAAEELGHGYVGTEHLLIGLIEEGSGVAAQILNAHGVQEEKVMNLVSQLIAPNNVARLKEPGATPPAPSAFWRTATGRRCALRRRSSAPSIF